MKDWSERRRNSVDLRFTLSTLTFRRYTPQVRLSDITLRSCIMQKGVVCLSRGAVEYLGIEVQERD